MTDRNPLPPHLSHLAALLAPPAAELATAAIVGACEVMRLRRENAELRGLVDELTKELRGFAGSLHKQLVQDLGGDHTWADYATADAYALIAKVEERGTTQTPPSGGQ